MVFGIPLIFLAGFGPVVAWRQGVGRQPGASAFRWPFLSAAAGAALCILAGLGSSVAGVVALSLCLFVVVCIGLELARGTVARHALEPGRGWVRAFTGLIGRNRRRYGGYVVHLGVVVGIVGIIGTTVYATVAEQIVKPGQTLRVHGYAITFKGIERHLGPNYSQTGAVLSVRHERRHAVPHRPVPALLRPRGPDREQRRDPHRLAHRQRPVRDLLGHRPERRRLAEGARQSGRRSALARWAADRARHAHRDLAGSARGAAPRTAVRRGAACELGADRGNLLLVGLVVAAVLFVVVPLLRSGASRDEWTTATAEQARRIELRERRDAAYVALRELELDHQTGKLDDRDYERATAELRAEALAALAALEDDDAGADPMPSPDAERRSER